VDKVGGHRLILDPRYNNAFCRYQPFSYESVTDVKDYLLEDDLLVLTDLKSGYHHIPLHESAHPFMCFQFEGKTYYYTHLPFGLAPACHVFTQVMAEVYKPLRAEGQRLSFYLDDAMFAVGRAQNPKARAYCIVLIMSALGLTLSAKSKLLPSTEGRFLGFLVHAPSLSFSIPSDRVAKILAAVDEVLCADTVCSRDLAKVAGMLVSVKEALHCGTLYVRSLFVAMSSEWDKPIGEFERAFAREDLEYWKENLPQENGRSWKKKEGVPVIVSGDASESCFAGQCELLDGPIIIGFSEMEAQLMQDKGLSSCVRETRCARLCVETVLARCGDTLRGATIEYHGDNLGSIFCLQKMTGVPEVFAEVKSLYQVARQYDVDLLFVWKRRSDQEMVAADALSRVLDSSQLFLRDREFKQVCRRFGQPTFDLFAGPNTGEHKSERYYSLYACPGSLGWMQ
jgi:hypothetical protein